ncbi:MAG: energy-coupling factor transporter ATPase [Acholeplasmatales bacterium]|jgi:energy-coupling factor transport system ATP-binding protein|nr:energy-coupling factor transporter ATPase [Acholeplasmatales bacterium]
MGIFFKNVNYSYKVVKTSYSALSDINLQIEQKGEFIAICGHTGSGKSTLVQHINGLIFPTSGSVTVDNIKLPLKRGKKILPLRKKVGLAFQFPEYQLFAETVYKDIIFGPKNFKMTEEEIKQNVKYIASKLGIKDILERFPLELSGGQMRKVALAGVLASNPDYIVLDEPTRGLDPRAREEIMNFFSELNDKFNKTIIMITHDMDVVSQYAKRVIVLKEGKIVFDDIKENLFVHPDFNNFNLDIPSSIKILKYLASKDLINYKPLYKFEEIVSFLSGDKNE